MFRWQLILAWGLIVLLNHSATGLKRGQYNQYKRFCIPHETYSGLPWDCSGYLMCKKGVPDTEVFWFECPQGLYYNIINRTCAWPESADRNCPPIEEFIGNYCAINPIAKIPHMDNCALYYDCSDATSLSTKVPHLKECNYPYLFSMDKMDCDDFNKVECDARKIPVSPCDYLSYSQCTGPNCPSCTEGIPGCSRAPDGKNPYPDRPLTKYFIECLNGKTVKVDICPEGVFDPVRRICALDLDPQAVENYCRANPRHKILHPGNCAHYYDCTKQTSRPNYEKYEMECIYPKLFSSLQRTCLPFTQVKCGGRYEPKAPCEYVADKCFGPNCPPCEEQNPSCISLPDGKNPYFGRENTPHYIVCEQERTKDITRCRNGDIFDPVRRDCVHGSTRPLPPIGGGGGSTRPLPPIGGGGGTTRPLPPIGGGGGTTRPIPPTLPPPGLPDGSLEAECRRNPQELRVDPGNCARYFNCSQRASMPGFKPYHHECDYPKLFSATRKDCMDFPSVDCGTRFEPKAPCSYENTKRMCNGAMCRLPCPERSPSCIGKPDGNNTFPGRELTPFYMTCLRDRTLSVGVCRYGIYDFTLGHCTTDLDERSVRSYCERNRNTVFPHVANCARYYNCSTNDVHPVFGRYQRECLAPLLFDIDQLQCITAKDVQCKWRFQPKDPCSYLTNQYCPEPNCPPCSDRFPSCNGLPDGPRSVPASVKEFVICKNGRYVEKRSCEPNVFDPITKQCKTTTPSFCTGLNDGKYLHGTKKTEYIICRNGVLISIESCAPYIFNAKRGRCGKRISCIGLTNGNYQMPQSDTEYYICRGGRFQRQISCAPNKFDSLTRKCAVTNLCAGLTDGRHSVIDSDSDYIVCLNFVLLRRESCSSYIFDPATRSCGQLRSCSKLADGNYQIPYSRTTYYMCLGGKYAGTRSCEPLQYDIKLKQCQIPSPECRGKADGNHSIPGSNTNYYVCTKGILSNNNVSCAPYRFNPILGKCQLPCTGLPNGNHASEVETEYIVCLNGNLVRKEFCAPYMFDAQLGVCSSAVFSCKGLTDGNYPVPRIDTGYFQCLGGKFQRQISCAPDKFDLTTRTCAVLNLCAGLTDGRHIVSDSDRDYIICLNYVLLRRESCSPYMFDTETKSCGRLRSCLGLSDGNYEVPDSRTMYYVCQAGKFMGKQTCEPLQYDANLKQCQTSSKECLGKADGNHAVSGRATDYYVCRNGVLSSTLSCAPHQFDQVTRECKQPSNPCSGLSDGNHPQLGVLGDYRYIMCSKGVLTGAETCYPYMFDTESRNCSRIRSCMMLEDGKYQIPYLQNKYYVCLGRNFMGIKSCGTSLYDPIKKECQNAKMCFGIENGNHPVLGTDADYFVCEGGRLTNVLSCAPQQFDIATRKCHTRPNLCLGVTNGRHPVEGKDSDYVICTDSVEVRTESCSPFIYDKNTKKCSRTIQSCLGLEDGRYPLPNSKTDYYECLGDNFVLIKSCVPNVYDPSSKLCTELQKDRCFGLTDGKHPVLKRTQDYIVCKGGILLKSESCAPNEFDTAIRDCRIIPSCVGRDDGNYPVSRSDTDYFICKNGALSAQISCFPSFYDAILKKCRDSAECTGLSDGNHPYPGQNDRYIVCLNNVKVKTETCAPYIYDINLKVCATGLSCAGLPNGNNQYPGRVMNYIICRNGEMIDTASCAPDVYDPITKRCRFQPTCRDLLDGQNAHPRNPMEFLVCRNGNLVNVQSCTFGFDPEKRICRTAPTCRGQTRGNHLLPGTDNYYFICENALLLDIAFCQGTIFNDVGRVCSRIPSCFGLADGFYPIPGRRAMYIRCQYGAAKEVKSCGKQIFDPIAQKCSTPSCAGLPNGRHNLAGSAYDYFVCSNNNLMEIKSCLPQLFHPLTKECRASPSCNGLVDGKYPLYNSNSDYIVCRASIISEVGTCAPRQFDRELKICLSLGPSCFGLPDGISPHPINSKEYIICKNGVLDKVHSCGDAEFNQVLKRCGTGPSCRDLPDGNNPDIDNKNNYIVCSYGALTGYYTCSPDNYDPVIRLCSSIFNTSDPDVFCSQNPTAIIPHPDNCAQYIACGNKNTPLGNYREECQYMQLFSTYTNSCRPYREVKCGVRPEPRAPCDYEKMRICTDPAGCPPCETQNPTCVGKRDGIQAFPSKLDYYIRCQDERTIDISKCPLSSPLFDSITGKCTFVLDPVNPGPYCEANPNEVIAHPDNCGQYIDCRVRNTALKNYRMECNYPDLWGQEVKACRNFNDVNCGTRKIPKSPCDYELNIPCMDPDNCIPCNLRMPSCVGLPDGKHPFPDKPKRYITCYRERTIKNEKCPSGVYDATLRACIDTFDPQNPSVYCTKRPLDKVANRMNCATYFDCSKPNSIYGPYLQECEYPLLFHKKAKKCRAFSSVRCGKRFEPMEPCEYLQNQQCTNLKPGEVCKPCHERLPSCIGRSDGNNTFPGAQNNRQFMTCFRNRTVFVRECSNGYYDPQLRRCMKSTDPVNPLVYCRGNGVGRFPHPNNCHQYYDCSKENSPLGPYLDECDYPLGFSAASKTCEMYMQLQCNGKILPQKPCDYLRNQCRYRPNDLNCKPCEERLPSCVGLPDGNNTFPGQELTPMYITCMANRTIRVGQCAEGYFHPRRLLCTTRLRAGVVRYYCNQNPGVIIANPMNCAQYFDCGEESKRARTYLRECPYPKFFDRKISICTNFTQVDCEYRREVIAPCDYLQNRCNPRDRQCIPCERRIPNCFGLPDGNNSYPGRPTEYFVCYLGRTIGTERCPSRSFFDQGTRRCIELADISENMVRRYCRIFVDAIFPHPRNCAQYYDCRQAVEGSYLRECRYPQLFALSGVCKNFSEVYCGDRKEPVAPCDYLQNLCLPNDTDCARCEDRLPSCRGLQDGNNVFPGRPSSEYYIKCFRDRTVSVEACQVSKYDQAIRKCSPIIDQVLMDRYCQKYPTGIVPDPMNCARYYNCSEGTIQDGIGYKYLRECKYPRLWNSTYMTTSSESGCVLFTDVNCTDRYEPKAPCEYVENKCLNGSCPEPCESQFPSCRTKFDGSNIFPGKENSEYYTVCYRERTVAIVTCTVGKYNHGERSCVGDSTLVNGGANPQGKR